MSSDGRLLSAEVTVAADQGPVRVHVVRPSGDAMVPGVVLLHDAAGMTTDLRRQAAWLAGEGFLAAAPDLFDGRSVLACLRSVVADYRRRKGRIFDRVEAVRCWVAEQPSGTGRVGVVGFCLGGSFALLLAGRGSFDAASTNYGQVPTDPAHALRGSCPIVGSYGGRDPTLRGAASRLEAALQAADVVHDVREYPDAGHGFLNDHVDGDVPRIFRIASWPMHVGFHEAAAADARRRIVTFLHQHLATDAEAHL